MARDTSVDLTAVNVNLDANRSTKWSVPPVLSTALAAEVDQGFIMTQGIVYQVESKGTFMYQNVSDNEDDYIEFSIHGDKDGVWGRLDPGSFLKCSNNVFLLNRTHRRNCKIAVFSA